MRVGFLVLAMVFAFGESVGDVTFTPAKLPCAFTIRTNVERTIMGETHYAQEDYHYDGGMFHMISVIDGLASSTNELAVRTDFPFKQQGQEYVPVFTAIPRQHCQALKHSKSTVADYVCGEWLGLYMREQVYSSVSDATFQGKKCKMYYNSTDSFEVKVYVDDDNYVIGSVRSNGERTDTSVVSYDFHAPLENFIMNKTLFPDCDAKAYLKPKEQC